MYKLLMKLFYWLNIKSPTLPARSNEGKELQLPLSAVVVLFSPLSPLPLFIIDALALYSCHTQVDVAHGTNGTSCAVVVRHSVVVVVPKVLPGIIVTSSPAQARARARQVTQERLRRLRCC